MTLTSALTADQMEQWGWRVPFIFGLLIGPVAYYIRRHVDETVEFKAAATSAAPLREALSDTKRRLLISFGAVVLCTVAMYTVLFMPTYATRQLGLPASGAFLASLLTGIIQVVLIPIFGAQSDRIGRLPIGFAAAGAMLVAVYPMFAWLAASPTLLTLLLVQAIMGVLMAAYMGGLPALMTDLFPTPGPHHRAGGQLFVRSGDFRGLCPLDQRLADRRDGLQARAVLLSDARRRDQPRRPDGRPPAWHSLAPAGH